MTDWPSHSVCTTIYEALQSSTKEGCGARPLPKTRRPLPKTWRPLPKRGWPLTKTRRSLTKTRWLLPKRRRPLPKRLLLLHDERSQAMEGQVIASIRGFFFHDRLYAGQTPQIHILYEYIDRGIPIKSYNMHTPNFFSHDYQTWHIDVTLMNDN